MKNIIRTISLIICAVIMMACVTMAAAPTGHENIEVIFSENSPFSEEQKEIITDIIVNGGESMSTYNVICSIFGHKYKTDCITSVHHNKFPGTSMPCLEEIYEVDCCERCGATETTLLDSSRIKCCNK